MTEVQLITAIWCGRCKTIKPEVEAICKMNGATYTVVDMATLEEEEAATIKSLPTIRVRAKVAATGAAKEEDRLWTVYTANTLEAFKQDLTAMSLTHPAYDDF
jgi:thiol-disulfide isomerase/thioredoxin